MEACLTFELPWPPSVNHYWRRVGARTLISRGGRAFRRAVCSILAIRGIRPLDGELALEVIVFPPDRRRRDLDNSLKSLLDALAHGGAYHDDSQVARLTVERQHVVAGGKVRVRIEPHASGSTYTIDTRSPTEMEVKNRTCLKCGKPFESAGPGNRICPRCQKVNNRMSGCGEAQMQKQRGEKRHNGNPLE